MPAQIIGKCAICGKETSLEVTYYHYPIKCECCEPHHTVKIEHCKDCIPSAPQHAFILIRGLDGKLYSKEINLQDYERLHIIQ